MNNLCIVANHNPQQDTERILNRQLTLIGQVYGIISTTSISRLSTSPDPKCINSNEDLRQAASDGNLTDVEFILQNCGAYTDVNTENNAKYSTPLILASHFGYSEIVKILLKQPQIEVNKANDENKTALFCASRRGYSKVVNLLLQHSQINVDKTDNEGNSALFWATRFGHSETVRLLIQHPQTDVNKEYNNSQTVLHTASHG